MTVADHRSGNPERLRSEIDSGRTGDKIAASDPAAAPLGTDAEAGGFPPTPDEVDEARTRERARPDSVGENAQSGAPTPDGTVSSFADPGRLRGKLLLIALALVVVTMGAWIVAGR